MLFTCSEYSVWESHRDLSQGCPRSFAPRTCALHTVQVYPEETLFWRARQTLRTVITSRTRWGRTTCDAARTPATEKAPNLCSRTEINFPLLVEPIEHRLMRPFIFLRTFVSSNQAKPSAFSSQLWSSQLVSPDGGHSKLELHFICKLSCDCLAKNSARTWKHFKRFQVGTCRVIQWIVFTVNTIHPANSVY